MLGLLVIHAGTCAHIELVTVDANPATGFAAIQPQLAHATAQGGELAVPDGRCRIEQCQYRLGAWADHSRCGIEKPVVIALLNQVIGVRPQIHRAAQQ
ncbi:hypothetical protein D3C85_668110 [compost metagenome]